MQHKFLSAAVCVSRQGNFCQLMIQNTRQVLIENAWSRAFGGETECCIDDQVQNFHTTTLCDASGVSDLMQKQRCNTCLHQQGFSTMV